MSQRYFEIVLIGYAPELIGDRPSIATACCSSPPECNFLAYLDERFRK